MGNLRFNTFFQTGLLLVSLAGGSRVCADWQPYHARYEVYRNGKLSGQLDVTFEMQGKRWNIQSEGVGLHGMARFLRARENEYAEGTLVQHRFQPSSYRHYQRVTAKENLWTASFDWQQRTVEIVEGRNVLKLGLESDTVDPLTLNLEIRRKLRDKDSTIRFMQVDDDKIKEMAYRQKEPESIDTPLGCMRTIPVERIKLGGTRFSRSWYASEMDFILVHLEHGKSNGDDIEMRITELRFGKEQITPGPGCDKL